jgi:Cu+-exporting ATPase
VATTENSPAAIELAVRGMHCAGCVANVEAALQRVAGVREARVNLATERATITLAASEAAKATDASSPGSAAAARLIDAVRAAGFEAEPVVSPKAALDQRRARREAELRSRGNRLLAATLIGLPVIAGHFGGIWLIHAAGISITAWGIVQGALAAMVIALAAGEMISGAARGLAARSANMDLLVALGSLTAYAAGWIGVAASTHELVLFDAAALIVLFVGLGKYLEARSRGVASAALERLFERLPAEALRVIDGELQPVPTETLRTGHRIRLPAHAAVPVDAQIAVGTLLVDESLVTGESLPVTRGPGEPLYGGSRVIDGSADALVTQPAGESTVARIARLVGSAQLGKTPLQRLADRAAGVFVPVVIAIALATFAGWWLARGDAFWAFQRMISVLVIACPCAMGLAVPMAVLVGTTRAAQSGILIRDVEALEAAGRLTDIVLDKTGTLTLGRPRLAALTLQPGWTREDVLRLAAAVEAGSEHPFARAIVDLAREAPLDLPPVSDLQSQPGAGLAASVDGRRVKLGTPAWVETTPGDGDRAPRDERGSQVCMSVAGRLAAEFRFEDALHPEARPAIDALRALGLRPRLLSGDRAAVVRSVAEALGVADFEAEVKPADKLEAIRRVRAGGGLVAMVGDGVNDSPALAAADVGIAIGAGADVAREAAAICLLGHSPALLPRTVTLARATRRNMHQNLAWAVGYNVLMLPAAILTPIPAAYASAAMMLSSLSVVWNALRLRRA